MAILMLARIATPRSLGGFVPLAEAANEVLDRAHSVVALARHDQ